METIAERSDSPRRWASAPIRPRAFPTEELESVPRNWLAGSVLATHLANGVNILFPAGERFFVRSVRAYLDRVADDPALCEAVRGFAGQEGRHAQAHDRFTKVLEAQGYDVQTYLRAYERLAFGFIERVSPPKLRLATTAAAEHFTAVMAENFLTEDMPAVHPAMQRLLGWHAAEEIEHRAVAFEVLRRVDPSYAWRMAGLAMATVTLGGFWIAGMVWLLSQEQDVLATVRREGAVMRDRQPFGDRVFGRGIRAYLRRDFHPSDRTDLDVLAAQFLATFEPSRDA